MYSDYYGQQIYNYIVEVLKPIFSSIDSKLSSLLVDIGYILDKLDNILVITIFILFTYILFNFIRRRWLIK